MDKDSTVVGNFCIKNTRYFSDDAVKALKRYFAPLSDGGRLDAHEFMVLNVGCMAE